MIFAIVLSCVCFVVLMVLLPAICRTFVIYEDELDPEMEHMRALGGGGDR